MAIEEGDGAAPKRGRVENLKPKTSAEARGRLGGIASGKAKRERKLVSSIIAEFLTKKHKVQIYDVTLGKIVEKELTADELFEYGMVKTMMRGDGATSSMLKAIAEINEGKTINLPGLTIDLSPEERERRIAELEAKRNKKKVKK